MATLQHTVDTKAITLTFRMPRFYGARMWLVVQLMRLAGLIAPVTIEVDVQ